MQAVGETARYRKHALLLPSSKKQGIQFYGVLHGNADIHHLSTPLSGGLLCPVVGVIIECRYPILFVRMRSDVLENDRCRSLSAHAVQTLYQIEVEHKATIVFAPTVLAPICHPLVESVDKEHGVTVDVQRGRRWRLLYCAKQSHVLAAVVCDGVTVHREQGFGN